MSSSTAQNSSPLRVLIAMGTRPEIIKLAPIIWAARQHPGIETIVCHSGQHTDLAEPMLEYFNVYPQVKLGLLRSFHTLPSIFGGCMSRVEKVFDELRPNVLVTQGDTATAAAMSLAAFYARIPVVHVEAGLRTGDITSPWPEEMNRRIASLAAQLHCAPTEFAADKLRAEGVLEANIEVTGNPVVDALKWTLKREGILNQVHAKQLVCGAAVSAGASGEIADTSEAASAPVKAPSVVLTAHRRENFGEPLENICAAVLELAQLFPDHDFHFITHPNPQAGPVVSRILQGKSRIRVVPPLSYPEFIRLMADAQLIISDSGGIQEEAPTLKVPLLVTRLSTERPEVLLGGAAKLVGTDRNEIVRQAMLILTHSETRNQMTAVDNPFGDGQAGERIVKAIWDRWGGVTK